MPLLEAPPVRLKRMAFLLGTWVSGEARHPEREVASAALDSAFGEIKRLEGLLSRFRDDSVVSRVNRSAHEGPVFVGEEVFAVLQGSMAAARISGGVVDPTVGPVVDLWKRAEKRGRVPDRGEVDECLLRVGHSWLELDEKNRMVRFHRRGMSLDLGAAAKGWIIDRAAEKMRAGGVEQGLWNAGGQILLWGPRAAKIGIRSPFRPGEIAGVISMRNESVATSANDERSVRIGGRDYGHILDPRSGFPAEAKNWTSVSVVARNAWTADMLSTAAFILGPAAVMEWDGDWRAERIVAVGRGGKKPTAFRRS